MIARIALSADAVHRAHVAVERAARDAITKSKRAVGRVEHARARNHRAKRTFDVAGLEACGEHTCGHVSELGDRDGRVLNDDDGFGVALGTQLILGVSYCDDLTRVAAACG